jgi:hypothetical protein
MQLLAYSEDGSSKLLQNAGTYSPIYNVITQKKEIFTYNVRAICIY